MEAGHDRFDYELVLCILGDFIEVATLKKLAGDNKLNLTHLALIMSERVNGVTARHTRTSERLFPGYVRGLRQGQRSASESRQCTAPCCSDSR